MGPVDANAAIVANGLRLAHDLATADLAALTTKLIADRAAAMGEAAAWRARCEHLEADNERLRNVEHFYREKADALAGDVARLSTEVVRLRGLSSRGDVSTPGEFDGALAEQQTDPSHGREP